MIALALLMMLQQTPQPEGVQAAPPAKVVPGVAVPAIAPAAPAAPVSLKQVKTIYVLPMGSAFDQFLANHLAQSGLFEIVTEPARADAIFTDRLGKAFEKQYEELYPSPKPEPEKKAVIEEEAAEEEKSPSFDVKSDQQQRITSFGRGKGTYFLVGRSGRSVLWSTYEKPKTTRPDDLNDSARAVANRLREAIKKLTGEIAQASQ